MNTISIKEECIASIFRVGEEPEQETSVKAGGKVVLFKLKFH
jgi:hypothetical protein